MRGRVWCTCQVCGHESSAQMSLAFVRSHCPASPATTFCPRLGQRLHRTCSKLCEAELDRFLSCTKPSLHRIAQMSLKSSQQNRGPAAGAQPNDRRRSDPSERPHQLNTVFQANLDDQAQPLQAVTPTQDISERSHIGVNPDHMHDQKG